MKAIIKTSKRKLSELDKRLFELNRVKLIVYGDGYCLLYSIYASLKYEHDYPALFGDFLREIRSEIINNFMFYTELFIPDINCEPLNVESVLEQFDNFVERGDSYLRRYYKSLCNAFSPSYYGNR